MNEQLHVVLGGKGAVGRAVIEELLTKGCRVRNVNRSGNLVGVENIHADLLDPKAALQAIHGATHVYLCVGLPYRTEVWNRDWEVVMKNTIDACEAESANLIYLDNIYLYGPAPLENPITEDHPQFPPSVKGKARKRTTDMMLSAIEKGCIQGVIGRAPDFYGPYAVNSPFYILFLEKMQDGKAPQTLYDPKLKHSYACTTDLGRGLVALALDETTYGQAWHLPTAAPTSIETMTHLFNQALGTNHTLSIMPTFLRKILSLFIGILKEANEMIYQFENEYIFSSEKFMTHFPDFQITSYEEGVRSMIASFQKQETVNSNL